jgi:hypothetical protein
VEFNASDCGSDLNSLIEKREKAIHPSSSALHIKVKEVARFPSLEKERWLRDQEDVASTPP